MFLRYLLTVSFLRNLRAYLEARPALAREIDERALRDHILERLRELERQGEQEGGLAALHEEWLPKLKWFVRYLEHLPVMDAPAEPAEALRFAAKMFDLAIGREDPETSLVERLEMQRLLRGYRDVPGLETYALENHLVAEITERRLQLTQLGLVSLRLRGRDAIRWLVTVETLQSLGRFDLWHLSAEALAEALKPQGTEPFHRGALSRAIEFGVLAPNENAYASVRYLVPNEMRDVVAAVLEHGPWHTAIRALLEDERTTALAGMVSTTAAVDATVEQTRLITHEVRNALVPVRHHLDALSSARESSGATADTGRYRVEAARRGVVRVLEFVEQLVTTTELIAEPITGFDLADIVRDATALIEGSERITVLAPPDPVLFRAPRQRLVLAVVNLVRNAIQAAAAPSPVQISWRKEPREVRIVVDDGGPGVTAIDRQRIFEDGVTLRQGGSGFGLAFTRRFVETSLRGKVWCEDSDLGGARFVVSIPLEHSP